MKINAIQAQPMRSMQKNSALNQTSSAVSSPITSSRANVPYATISFGGAKNKLHVAHYMAEFPPFMNVGGVATVGDDYKNMNDWMKEILKKEGKPTENIKLSMFMPYYNGQLVADAKGDLTGAVSVRTLADGTPIYIHANDIKTLGSADEAIKQGKYFKLEQVGETKQMQWGVSDTPITLYKVLPDKRLKSDVDFYMVYSNDTASKPIAYADGGYSSYSSSGVPTAANGFKGDAYAQNNKAFTELLPLTEKNGFNPETIICSDAQCCYVPEYMAHKQLAGEEYYKGMKLSAVFHNMADGYTENKSAIDMFSNFASKEDIEAVMADPRYQQLKLSGDGKALEEYFQQFMKPLVAKSAINPEEVRITPNMIPLYYVKDENGNFVNTVRTVSCGYAQSVAENPSVSPFLHSTWKELYAQGKVGGILNGFDKPGVRWDKDFPGFVGEFNKNFMRDANGKLVEMKPEDDISKAVFRRFKTFQPDADGNFTYEAMRETKRENKINFLERLTKPLKEGEDFVVTGNKSRVCKVRGTIDNKYVDMLKKGNNIPVFVSWGRGDKQKGYPITIKAFSKFAQTEEGKNAILVMGGELADSNPEKAVIKTVMDRELDAKGLAGRYVFIDGFAPGYPMAAMADASVLPSTFAPCELTDIESARYLSTPIVTNTQGMKQKNFDPRNPNEAAIANAYKTMHEFCIPDDEIEKIVKAYGLGDTALQEEVKKKYFRVDEGTFKEFGEQFNLRLEESKKKLLGYKYEAGIPANIDDIALNKLKDSDAFERLITRLKENMLGDEVCAAMVAKVKGMNENGGEIDRLIFKNQMAMDTRWGNNSTLRSQFINTSKASSEEMYYSMVDVTPGKVITPAVNTKLDVSSLANGDATSNIKNNTTGFMSKIKSGLKDKRVLAAIAGIAAVGAIAFGVTQSNKKAKPSKEAVEEVKPAPAEQTPPPPPPPPAPSAVPASQAPAVSQPIQQTSTTPSTAQTVSTQASAINLSNNKFAACFNKMV